MPLFFSGDAVMMVYQTECTSKSCYQIVIANTCKSGHNVRCPLKRALSVDLEFKGSKVKVCCGPSTDKFMPKYYMNGQLLAFLYTKGLHERTTFNVFIPKDYMNGKC
jgi:hypothetical protein